MKSSFRRAASIVILRHLEQPRFGYDYDILMMKRGPKGRQVDMWSYPGGVIDEDDNFSHSNWKTAFQELPHSDLKKYLSSISPLSLREQINRIGAIRETFQEVRIPIILPTSQTDNFEEVRLKTQNFKQFIAGTKTLPDINGLYRLFRIITPKLESMTRRYDTQFYLYFLENPDIHLIGSQGEVSDLAWKTPHQFLEAYYSAEMKYLPPQWVITSFLSRHHQLQHIKDVVAPLINLSPASVHPNIPLPQLELIEAKDVKLEPQQETHLILWKGARDVVLKSKKFMRVLLPGDEEYHGEDYQQIIQKETGNPDFKYKGAKGARNRQYWLRGKVMVSHQQISSGVGIFGQVLGIKTAVPKL